MNIAPSYLPAPHLAHEPSRPAQQAAQETTRPVIAPNQTGAITQEARRNEERRINRDSGRQDNARAEHEPNGTGAATEPPTNAQQPSAGTGTDHPEQTNLVVGTLLDVFV